ncbi:MAG: hypothetical protein EOP07_16655 [Proteobacteria bacterium]|nr:MAG: hypothetical protein EOP07_16655 [Pseudomonadota bacterium]
MKLRNLAIAALGMIPFSAAHANTAIDGTNRFTGGLLLQDTSYETDDSFDVEGQLLVGGYKAAINPKFSIGGGIGLMIDGEIGDGAQVGDGSGFRLFGDAQYEIHRINQNKILLTGTLSHDRFSFSEGQADIDFTITEFKIGGLFLHEVRDFSLYAGLELVAYSDGEVESGNFNADANRDDRLNIRLGASFNATPKFALRGDLLLIGEQTLLLAADFAL